MAILGGELCLKVKVQNRKISLFAEISNVYWGMPDKPDLFLFGTQLMLGPSLRIKKKGSTPPHENARTVCENCCLRVNSAIQLLMFDQEILL